ncbi:MAG TPA: enoyl-CoA hydratase-related protein, partial [Polyangiaceae bacterium]|nr:enoyl-CoA hydratase-related protein [Polyangiaceae bacterium]
MANLVTVTQHDGIAVVTLDNPPVNALSHATRLALLSALKERFEASGVEALVIACEGRTFIAGADIREFGKPPLAPDLPELVEFLDGAPVPTIAAIHGTALGGGLELALACDFRVATENAKLGLPEVALGILPGAGGTQRLPRLIGIRAALEMIVSGIPISATEARRKGLVDECVAGDVKELAIAFARRVLAERRPRRRVSSLTVASEDLGAFEDYARISAERWPGFLAPSRCIEAIRAAGERPFNEGLRRERELFRELVASVESKAQRHVFFGEREVAKLPDLPDGTPTRVIKSVAVLGETASASGIARCFADARIPVALFGHEPSQSERVLSAVREDYLSAVAQGHLSRAECDARLQLIRSTQSEEDA